MNNRIKNVNGREKDENTMWLRTQLLQGTVPLGALFFVFFSFSHLFVMIWWLVQILYSFSPCQCKFLVSRVDFGKPSFCFQAKTWFAKINRRDKELALTIEKEYRICASLQVITKSWLKGKKTKSTSRGTLSCNRYVLSHILFSIFFLSFTFLILLFIFPATVSACLRLCANKQKPWLKKWAIGLKMWTVETKMRAECDWEHIFCKEQSLYVCSFLFFFPSVTFLWWFGNLYKFCTPFATVNSSSLCLWLILANHVFAWKRKPGLLKSTGETRNLNWP